MDSFDVPINERLRLIDIIEMKKKDLTDERNKRDFDVAFERIHANLPKHVFLSELTLLHWHDCMKKLSQMVFPIKYGSQVKRTLTLVSIRRVFANISSAFSHAISLGIPLENYPLKVIQLYLNPALKNGDMSNEADDQ
jgi:hypothetical protein